MKIPVEKQIKILKIVNIFMVVGIIGTGYLMFLKYQETNPHILTGSLEYLKEKSRPANPAVGVYLKLILNYPKYAKFGKNDGEDVNTGFFIISNSTTKFEISVVNTTHNVNRGVVVDVEDKNGNGVIDTGDIFHIYGRNLKGYEIGFCVTGVSGIIQIKVS